MARCQKAPPVTAPAQGIAEDCRFPREGLCGLTHQDSAFLGPAAEVPLGKERIMSLFTRLSRLAKAGRPAPTPSAPAMFETLESRQLCSVSILALHAPTVALSTPTATHVVIGTAKNGSISRADDDGNYCGNGLKPNPFPRGGVVIFV